jgi:hypothetical protein
MRSEEVNIASIFAGWLILKINRPAAKSVVVVAFYPRLFAIRRLSLLDTAVVIHKVLRPLLATLANSQFTKRML